jgi:hypothetical protein
MINPFFVAMRRMLRQDDALRLARQGILSAAA